MLLFFFPSCIDFGFRATGLNGRVLAIFSGFLLCFLGLGVMNLLLFWLWINGRRKNTGLAWPDVCQIGEEKKNRTKFCSVFSFFFFKKRTKILAACIEIHVARISKKINSC
jgi:hypothetical protein